MINTCIYNLCLNLGENSFIMAITVGEIRNQKIHPLWQLLTGGEI